MSCATRRPAIALVGAGPIRSARSRGAADVRRTGSASGFPAPRAPGSGVAPSGRAAQPPEPLGARRGLPVETADELVEGADVEAAAGFVRSLDARPTVL